MKMLSKLSILPCLFLGLAANAQSETVAPSPKMQPQLYFSLGTGPALTTNKDSHPFGGTYMLNITGACGSGSVYRLNVQHSVFYSEHDTKSGPFTYLGGYNNSFTASENTSISLAYGWQNKLNDFVLLQAFGGLGFNQTSQFEYPESDLEIMVDRPKYSYAPGLLLQAEAMFLPSKFAGLTLGTYANITPKLPSAGLSLSVNLGLLK